MGHQGQDTLLPARWPAAPGCGFSRHLPASASERSLGRLRSLRRVRPVTFCRALGLECGRSFDFFSISFPN